jgi:hypothetical protein
MKTILTIILTILALYTNAKIVYVDNNDQAITTYGVNTSYSSNKTISIPVFDEFIKFVISQTSTSCSGVSQPYIYSVNGTGNISFVNKNSKGDTLDYRDLYSNNNVILASGSFPSICFGSIGRFALGFRVYLTDTKTNVKGFVYGYVDYSITSSGDIVVHGYYYNDATNQPIVVNNTTTYPYNGCVYQDTIKTYVNVNVYDTIKIPKTIYDTVKITKIEIVKKTVYDTIKIEKIIHKTICDSTVLITVNDTVTKIIYDTIKTHVTINDTIHKTIYTNVKINVYDTINVPVAVTDTLIIKLNKTKQTQIRIWPNPTQQSITIDRSDNIDGDIIIIDQNGKTLVNMKANTQILQLDVSQWSVGTYTLIIKQNENTITKHLQIIR